MWCLLCQNSSLGVATTCDQHAGWETTYPVSLMSGRKTVLPVGDGGKSLALLRESKLGFCHCFCISTYRITVDGSGIFD